MNFEVVTPYYAECKETKYRVIKYFCRGVPDFSAWHPSVGFIKHGCQSAKEAARVCRDHFENGVRDGQG